MAEWAACEGPAHTKQVKSHALFREYLKSPAFIIFAVFKMTTNALRLILESRSSQLTQVFMNP